MQTIQQTRDAQHRLIVALDVPTFELAADIVESLGDEVQIFKVGSQLFTACGPKMVRYLMSKQKQVFLDLKYHDIPNTVANALESAVNLCKNVHPSADEDSTEIEILSSLAMCTIHTVGGAEMMRRAVDAATQTADNIGVKPPIILGITVLTSEMKRDNIHQLVLERALLARDAGCDGVVCSSQEAAHLRSELGSDFVIVTPGIRPAGSESHDQKRVSTPRDAIGNGSDFIVVGRPIVKADRPVDVAKMMNVEIREVLNNKNS